MTTKETLETLIPAIMGIEGGYYETVCYFIQGYREEDIYLFGMNGGGRLAMFIAEFYPDRTYIVPSSCNILI